MIEVNFTPRAIEDAYEMLTRAAQALAPTNLTDAHALLALADDFDAAMRDHAMPRLYALHAEIAQGQLDLTVTP